MYDDVINEPLITIINDWIPEMRRPYKILVCVNVQFWIEYGLPYDAFYVSIDSGVKNLHHTSK